MPKSKRSQVPDEPEIPVPFPPTITARELISDKKDGKKAKKPPNAFMIYRKVFSKVAKTHRFQQKKISSLCSSSWKREPEEVKKVYRRLAHDADRIFLQDLQNHSQIPQLPLPLPPQQMLPPSQLLQSEMDKYLECFDDMEKQQETQSIVPNTLDSLDANQGYIQQLYYPIYGPINPTFFEENYYYSH